ncbi:thioester domain-containing protein [Actinophytocola sediminis]
MFDFARAGAAVAGTFTTAAVALVVAAAPAAADAATGQVDHGSDLAGFTVDVGDDVFGALATSLIGLRLGDGTVLGTYCVEIQTEIDDRQELVERPWEEYPAVDSPFTANQAKINWVLHNGFPVLAPDALTEALTGAGADLADTIDEQEAVTATQAAVWHFSDGTDLDRDDPLPGEESSAEAAADVLALYDFLTGEANVGIAEEPTAALAIDPDSLVGGAGELIGPFTVSTTAEVATLTAKLPDGVIVADADGNELGDQVRNGTEVFLAVPADAAAGEATIEVAAKAVVDTGRLFVGADYYEAPTQSLIVAKAEETEVTATAKGSWNGGADAAPAAQGKNDDSALANLAETGASILAPVLLGAVLIGAGIVSVLFVRNRRRA